MAVKYKWSFILFFIIWVKNGLATQQVSKPTGTNACISKQTCHDCVQTPSCAWCSLPDFDNKRCFLPYVNLRISEECPDNFTFNPDNEYIKIRHKELWKGNYIIDGGKEEGIYVESEEYQGVKGKFHSESVGGSRTSFNNKQEAVQLYPQEINLKLRINEVQKIKIEYAQAEDYPVDLYYLMDLSNSMKDDKQKLSDLGQLLVESMSNITSNFRLGFGSFVDKVVMPYVSMVPKALKEPCDGCAAPYGYRNHMPLSQNTEGFAKEVRDAPVSGNLDAPEGGFDAIMQAIVCRDEIKWREKARKLLLFSTDAGFHFAGDGKLSGIVKPNDGCCHLDKKGLYTHSTVQDYPSISQINLKVKENSVNIIWAVTEEQIKIYQSLTKHIEGSYAAKLSEDSSNIVDLVREQYNAISSSVEMKDTASNYVNIKYYSNCLEGGQMIETNKCDGLKVGNKVEFTAEIVVSACPQNRSEWKQKFYIYPVGINESLTVNLDMICDCDCEISGQTGFEFQSVKCNGHGDLSCGICMCYEGFFGKNCECGANDRGQTIINEFACRRDNTSNVDCGGRGSCECNVCICNTRDDTTEMIWGEYCQCDNFSCDRRNNTICSGHGSCNCGNCECFPGWQGNACECSTDTNSCVKHGLECSGHGVCECGKCKCNVEEGLRYSGQYCQICRTCPSRCEELKPCVLCKAFKAGNLTESECNSTCGDFETEIVETLEVDVDQEETGCWGYDEQDCKYYFAYYYNMTTNKLQVKVQRARECPPQVYVLGIVLGVIAAVVLIGLALLLVWKLLTTIHDRREFARFEKERMMAKWDASENPIYRQATSTFKNPTYAAGGVHAPLNKSDRFRDVGDAPGQKCTPEYHQALIPPKEAPADDGYTLIYKKKHTMYTRTVSPSDRMTDDDINDDTADTIDLINDRTTAQVIGRTTTTHTMDRTTGNVTDHTSRQVMDCPAAHVRNRFTGRVVNRTVDEVNNYPTGHATDSVTGHMVHRTMDHVTDAPPVNLAGHTTAQVIGQTTTHAMSRTVGPVIDCPAAHITDHRTAGHMHHSMSQINSSPVHQVNDRNTSQIIGQTTTHAMGRVVGPAVDCPAAHLVSSRTSSHVMDRSMGQVNDCPAAQITNHTTRHYMQRTGGEVASSSSVDVTDSTSVQGQSQLLSLSLNNSEPPTARVLYHPDTLYYK